jgi:hypothetical protein
MDYGISGHAGPVQYSRTGGQSQGEHPAGAQV